jgi:L-cystine uptake protein TcyP (sodium:dicarboxylate symporter family)
MEACRCQSLYAELRKSTLSYQILKIQRNKYINFLVIFTFAITVAFFWIKQQRYELEEKFKDQLATLQRLEPDFNADQD